MLPKIIEELAVMAEKEREDRNPFKVRAYEKVIAGLKAHGHPLAAAPRVGSAKRLFCYF